MAVASDILQGELCALLAATTPRLCDGLRWLVENEKYPATWNFLWLDGYGKCGAEWTHTGNSHKHIAEGPHSLPFSLWSMLDLHVRDSNLKYCWKDYYGANAVSKVCLAVALAWEQASDEQVAEWERVVMV